MAITSIGYDGSVDEKDWAALAPYLGAEYRNGGVSLVAVGNVDRTVRVSAGLLFGYGVLDTLSGNTDLQAAAIASGTRWDTVVLRRDWQPTPGGGSTLMILTGTSAQRPAASVKSGPGVLDDQILGLIKLQSGLTTIQEVVPWTLDRRHIPMYRASETLPDPAGEPYGQPLLQFMNHAIDILARVGGPGSESWLSVLNPDWSELNLASGYQTFSGDVPQYRVIGGELKLRGRFERTNHAAFSNAYTTVASVPPSFGPKRESYQQLGSSFSSATGGGGMCHILTSGLIQVQFPADLVTWASLDNISVAIG